MSSSLQKFWPLLRSAWQLMKAAYWPLFITLIPLTAASGVEGLVRAGFVSLGPGWLWPFVVDIAAAWSTVAAVRLLDKDEGAIGGLLFPARHILPFLGTVVLLQCFLLVGFLPLVAPGIVLAFALSFTLYAFATEGLTGSRALRRSSQLVRTYARSVVGRLLAFFATILGPILILPLLLALAGAMLIQGNAWGDITGRLASGALQGPAIPILGFALFDLSIFLLTPLLVAFAFTLFRELQARVPVLPMQTHWYDHLAFPRYLGAWLVIVIVFPVSFILLNQGDEPFRFQSYLTLQAVKVPDNENAFFPLQKLTGTLVTNKPYQASIIDLAGVDTTKLYTQYMAGDFTVLPDNVMSNLVARNKEAFAVLHEIAQYHRLQFPANWDPQAMGPNSPFYPIGGGPQNLARFAILTALYQAQHGDLIDAISELNDTLAFAYLLRNQEPGPMFITQFIGVAIDRMVYQGLYKLAQSTPLPKQQLGIIAQRLLVTANQTDTGTRAAQMEMGVFNIKSFSDLGDYAPALKDPILINYSFKVNAFKNHTLLPYAVIFDQMSSCQKSPLQEEENEISAQLFHSSRLPYLLGLPGPGGLSNFLETILFVDIGGNPARDTCSTQFYGRALAVILAIKAYQLDHGGILPGSLAALVPVYLPSVPEDPYGKGAPIIWDQGKGLLVSVGSNISSPQPGTQPSPDDTPSIGVAQPGTFFTNVVSAAQKYKIAKPPTSLQKFLLPPPMTPEAQVSRDARRLKDILSISRALMAFHGAIGVYPISVEMSKAGYDASGALGSLKIKGYLSTLPSDPLSVSMGWFYGYQSDGFHYTLTARLESTSNKSMCDSATKDICLYRVTEATPLPNTNGPAILPPVSLPQPPAPPPPF